jgi:hypothetical protein
MPAMKWPTFRLSSSAVAQDADDLLTSFGEQAYEVARTRAREARLGDVIDGNRTAGHWDRVRREVARRTGRAVGLDSASKRLAND